MPTRTNHPSGPSIDIAGIGNRWVSGAIVHNGVASELHVRKLPPDFNTPDFPFVALAFLENDCEKTQAQEITKTIQARLESGSRALLVAAHYLQSGRVYWYAHAGSKAVLDELFAAMGDDLPLFLGVNEDTQWKEYRFMQDLVGASATTPAR